MLPGGKYKCKYITQNRAIIGVILFFFIFMYNDAVKAETSEDNFQKIEFQWYRGDNTAFYLMEISAANGEKFTINWGDGSKDTLMCEGDIIQSPSHDYQESGLYNVVIKALTENCNIDEFRVQQARVKSIDFSNITTLKSVELYQNELEKLDLSNNPKLYRLVCRNNKLKTLILPTGVKYVSCANNALSIDSLYSVWKCLRGEPDQKTYSFGVQSIEDSLSDVGKKYYIPWLQPIEGIVPSIKILFSGVEASASEYEIKEDSISFFKEGYYTLSYTHPIFDNSEAQVEVNFSLNVGNTTLQSFTFETNENPFGPYLRLLINGTPEKSISIDWGDGTKEDKIFDKDRDLILEHRGSKTQPFTVSIAGKDKATFFHFLDVSYSYVKSIDISKIRSLETLKLKNNNLRELNLSENVALIDLDCSMNELDTLFIENSVSLKILDCGRNKLKYLFLHEGTTLNKLDCSENCLSLGNVWEMSKNVSQLIVGTQIAEELKLNRGESAKLELSEINGIKTEYIVELYGAKADSGIDYTINNENITFLSSGSYEIRATNSEIKDENAVFKTSVSVKLTEKEKFTISLKGSKDKKFEVRQKTMSELNSYRVDWGDGKIDTIRSSGAIIFTHAYQDTSVYRVVVENLQDRPLYQILFLDKLQMLDLDISTAQGLPMLSVTDNMLNKIDVSNNKAITQFVCSNNKLSICEAYKIKKNLSEANPCIFGSQLTDIDTVLINMTNPVIVLSAEDTTSFDVLKDGVNAVYAQDYKIDTIASNIIFLKGGKYSLSMKNALFGADAEFKANYVVKEIDISLLSLSVSQGVLTPEFNKQILLYEVNLPYEKAKIVLNAQSINPNANVSGTGEKVLEYGKNSFNIEVSLEEQGRKYSLVYVIDVNRAFPDSNADLKALSVGEYDLDTIFSVDVLKYTVEVEHTIDSITINATPASALSTVSGTGKKGLNTGKNTFNIEVVAQSGKTKIYSIDVLRVENVVLDSNANLESLTISGVDLQPIFDKDILKYTANVNYSLKEVEVSATPQSKKSKVEGTGLYKLSLGNNIIKVKVIAQDNKNTKIYTVDVFKADTLSLELNNKQIEAFVYPNPVSSVLNIKCGEFFNYSILNSIGEKLMEGSNNNAIQVSGLSKGLYFLRIDVEGKGAKILRFIKD